MNFSVRQFSEKFKVIFLAITLAAITLLVFSKVCRFPFVNYDDNQFIFQNPYLAQGITPQSITWAVTAGLTRQSIHCDYWQPITILSRLMDVHFFGMNPGAHHAANLCLHILNALILFFAFGKASRAWAHCFIVSCVFAIHPIQIESVAWITARKELLSGFFALLSISIYLNSGKSTRFLALFFYLLAMLSKPIPMFPFLLIILDIWPLQHIGNGNLRSDLSKSILEKIPFFVVSMFGFLIFNSDLFIWDFSTPKFLNQILVGYPHYLKTFFYPFYVGIYGPSPHSDPSLFQEGMGAALILGISYWVLCQAKTNRFLVAGWFWFLLGLIPAVGFEWVADRFAYLPMIGLAIISVWGFELWLKSSIPKAGSIPSLIVCISIFLILSFASFRQLEYWRNTKVLFQRALELNPSNFVAHNNLGNIFVQEQRLTAAMEHFTKSQSLNPRYALAYNGMGLVSERFGKINEAIFYYQEALRYDPALPLAYSNLGNLYLLMGKKGQAIQSYQKALLYDPFYISPYIGLGQVFLRQQDWKKAADSFSQALQINPHAEWVRKSLLYAQSQLKQNSEKLNP